VADGGDAAPALLELAGVSRRFGGLLAVDSVALQVMQGGIVALVGPNGAGKTTLFALIAGFLKPDRGRIRFAGRDIAGLAPHLICRRGLARTFQIVQPFGALSVRENIAVGAHLRHAGRRAALAHATAMAERVGMAGMLDQPAAELTIAGRKRLELARVLATGPRLLLLDEVMAGLTPPEIAAIVPVIRGLADDGLTIVMIEHVMQAVASLADEVHVLNQGRLIARGSLAEIAADPVVVEAYLGHGAAAKLGGGTAGVGGG